MFEVVLRPPGGAFGEGTRPAGFVFGMVDGAGGIVELADGVTGREMAAVLRNPHVWEKRELATPRSAVPASQDAGEDAGAPSDERDGPRKAPPRRTRGRR